MLLVVVGGKARKGRWGGRRRRFGHVRLFVEESIALELPENSSHLLKSWVRRLGRLATPGHCHCGSRKRQSNVTPSGRHQGLLVVEQRALWTDARIHP